MSLHYLEKIRSKLRSLTFSDFNRPSAELANTDNADRTIDERHNYFNKCIGLKSARCWPPQKPKPPKIEGKMDQKTSSLPIETLPETEDKAVFMMGTSRSQPSPKMEKRNDEKKIKKLKMKDIKVVKENFVKSWDESEASKQVGKVRRRWGWEKREGEFIKKKVSEELVVEIMKSSVESQVPELCKCGNARNVTLVVKNFCQCDKLSGAKVEPEKPYVSYRKRKPKTAPHLTDSLIVYKERMSRKSDRLDKAEDEVAELPVKKKEGKGVSFSKDVVFRKRKNMEESLITLYQNSNQKKSACGLTKEQYERIKSSKQQAKEIKKKSS